MKTEEGNKLIAEFMGEKFTDGSGVVQGLNYKLIEKKHGKGNNGFRFHTSWDWLMPVVEKIDLLTSEDSLSCITFNRCTIDHFDGEISFEGLGDSRIEAVWNCVCEFITWYNENNK